MNKQFGKKKEENRNPIIVTAVYNRRINYVTFALISALSPSETTVVSGVSRSGPNSHIQTQEPTILQL